MEKIKKIKPIWIVGGIILLLVIYGIANNPDRKINKIHSEFEDVFQSSASDAQELLKNISENKECFGAEAIKNTDHLKCATNIELIQINFNTLNAETLKKYEEFYSSKNSLIDEGTKIFLENAIKLYKSESYAQLSQAYNDFFSMFSELHTKPSKGVKNMTSTEIENVRFIAEKAGKSADDLNSTLKDYNDYLNKNFDPTFVNMINQAGQVAKESINQK